MVLKRKRSSSELCLSPSASSTCSSAFSFSSPRMTSPIQAPIFWDSSSSSSSSSSSVSRNLFSAPAHLNSRTMKRFRDNRPSEEMVHQRTLNLLFSAQQQRQHHEDTISKASELQTPSSTSSTTSTQHSLHRFWNISSTPKPPTGNTSSSQPEQLSNSCEDCGSRLESGSMMMSNCSGTGASECGACGKQVCFSCSVSNLGEEKRCLYCAGRTPVGWTDMAMQLA